MDPKISVIDGQWTIIILEPVDYLGVEFEMTINSETDHVKLKEIGNEAFKKGDFELALDAYTKAMDIAKEEKGRHEVVAILYKNRAAVHLKSEDFQCAVEDCTKALDLVREVEKCLPLD